MFDHLNRKHERRPKRTAGGVAVSVLVHLGVLALVLYLADRAGSGAAPRASYPQETEQTLEIGGTYPYAGGGVGPGADTARLGVTLPADQLQEAEVPGMAARVPDTLELGRPHPMRVALPPNRLSPDRVLTMRGLGGAGVRQVRFTPHREVTLTGPDLVVIPETPTLRVLDEREETEWRWSVTPTEPGLHTVQLQLDAVAQIDGEPRVVTLQRVDREIVVRATPLQHVSRFFAQHWTWLSVLALLLLVHLARARREPAATAPGPRPG